jgi:hypothetical protein
LPVCAAFASTNQLSVRNRFDNQQHIAADRPWQVFVQQLPPLFPLAEKIEETS